MARYSWSPHTVYYLFLKMAIMIIIFRNKKFFISFSFFRTNNNNYYSTCIDVTLKIDKNFH